MVKIPTICSLASARRDTTTCVKSNRIQRKRGSQREPGKKKRERGKTVHIPGGSERALDKLRSAAQHVSHADTNETAFGALRNCEDIGEPDSIQN